VRVVAIAIGLWAPANAADLASGASMFGAGLDRWIGNSDLADGVDFMLVVNGYLDVMHTNDIAADQCMMVYANGTFNNDACTRTVAFVCECDGRAVCPSCY
jgi:hypothetical protein